MNSLLIKDFAKVKGGKRLPKGKTYTEAQTTHPYLRVTDFGKNTIIESDLKYISEETHETIKRYIISKEDIYISIAGTIGKVGWVPEKLDGANLTENAAKITEINGYNHRFLVYYLSSSSAQKQIHENTKSTSQPKLALYRIEGIRVPLFPLPIQRAIVSKIEALLSDLDKGIADLKKAQEQLKIYRQAVLKKAFEGELTKEWREQQTDLPTADELLEKIKEERHKHYEQQLEEWKQAVKEWEENGEEGKKPGKPKKYKELPELRAEELSLLTKLPDGWKWEKNENFIFEVKDGTHDTPKYKEKGIPFITQKNIKKNNITFEDVKFISEEDHNSFFKRSNVEKGDIIIAMIGHSRGNCCIVDTNIIFSIKNVGLFKFFHEFQNNKYCLNYYQSTLGLNLALRTSKGGAQPFIGLTELRNWSVPICSKQEQHQIVREIESRLSVCDKVEQNITEALEKSEALRQSILKKAFEGKLLSETEIEACKREADYEPASVLLERIRKERPSGK